MWKGCAQVSVTGERGTELAKWLSRSADHHIEEQSWGQLTWMVSAAIGNSENLTVGICRISAGNENPRHYHPNCDEVLYVVEGKIEHSLNDAMTEMRAGDAISIPEGSWHNARNVGESDAVLLISFSSAYRETVGE